jgi:AraC-like DNA-binding protein
MDSQEEKDNNYLCLGKRNNLIHFIKSDSIEIVEGKGMPEFPFHTHNSFIIGAIIEGKVLFTTNGQDYILEPGTVYINPPNTGMSIKPFMPYRYITICIKNDWIMKINLYSFKNYIIKADITEDILKPCEHFKKSLDSGSNEQKFVHQLIRLIEKEYDLNSLPKEYKQSDIIKESVQYINKEALNHFCLDRLSDQLHISKYYLIRLFKKEMDITPKQYFLQAKLRLVKDNILCGNSETKIAMDMEFAAQSHLCSLFKRYMGITISEYKKNMTHN